MYERYLDYVKEYLIEHKGLYSENENQTFRSRYEHTIRVMKWLDIISEGMDIDREALYMAAVFHDIGYEDTNKSEHGKRGAKAFEKFGREQGFDEEFIRKVSKMIEMHSDKEILGTDIPLELTLLMEADQMDEEGTMRIMWDCMVQGKVGAKSYKDAYNRMVEFASGMPNRMITEKAKIIWEHKRKLYKEFLAQLENDLFIGDSQYYKKILENELSKK